MEDGEVFGRMSEHEHVEIGNSITRRPPRYTLDHYSKIFWTKCQCTDEAIPNDDDTKCLPIATAIGDDCEKSARFATSDETECSSALYCKRNNYAEEFGGMCEQEPVVIGDTCSAKEEYDSLDVNSVCL